jgi:ubiquinone/menaquinone biosynthesis C-methylase UbiE
MKDNALTWEEAVIWLRSQPNQDELVKACYFDDPLSAAAYRFQKSAEWVEIQKRLPKSKGSVLDIGAGRGISSFSFAHDGWEVAAIEPDPSSIVGAGAIKQLAAETTYPISVFQAFAEILPFKDKSFDVVYGRQILHHAGNLSMMCKEMSRVLKPGGIFIATREHVISKPTDLNHFLAHHPLQKVYGGENAYTLKTYMEAIQQSGIAIKEVLNPLSSDINLFPECSMSMKTKIAQKIHFPFPELIPTAVLRIIGRFNQNPGRLYSFIGRKAYGQ